VLYDLVHLYNDHASPRPPCRDVGMTVDLPGLFAGIEITAHSVRWPDARNGQLVGCGACGGYLGECLNATCIRPHRCWPVQRPDGRFICRAGCDGGKP
jgi:hypothetical protein